jgi:signal transduction histidine kinase
MRVLPLDSTVNLFDLAFKLKRVYEGKAKDRELNIRLEGVRAVITGSQKSFPIVPAVLIENAIKYAVPGTTVLVDVSANDGVAELSVTNAARETIDPVRCFERGVRFSKSTEGSGFGLYIAKEIVTAHGGTIRCESADGTVTMTISLPLKTVVDMERRTAVVR